MPKALQMTFIVPAVFAFVLLFAMMPVMLHSGGADGWTIIRSHLLPHLKESFLILIVQEVLLVLTLFGQLAIFQIFVGGTTMYPDPIECYSRSNEWGGLIGQSRMNFYVNQWMFYVPMAAYMTLIIGFHLVSKGLEQRYSKLFSKFLHL